MARITEEDSVPCEEMAACRAGDGGTLVIIRLDWLSRSLPDVSEIAHELTARDVVLSFAGIEYDSTDPVGWLRCYVLGMVAEFEAGKIRMRIREGLDVAMAKGRLREYQPKR